MQKLFTLFTSRENISKIEFLVLKQKLLYIFYNAHNLLESYFTDLTYNIIYLVKKHLILYILGVN